LKNLEQAQKEQNSEQSEEIERLRYENDELRRENDVLRAQVYGPSASSSHSLLPTPHNIPSITNERRAYSLSPSMSAASLSGTASPPASLGSDLMGLSMTSPMLPPSLTQYSDPSALSDQQYSMVLQSGVHPNPQTGDLAEPSGYGSARAVMGSSYSSLNMSGSMPAQTPQANPHRSSGQQVSSVHVHNHSPFQWH
jgi:hypothetical protein